MAQLQVMGLPAPRVVTKLDTSIAEATSPAEVVLIVNASVANSKKMLGLEVLPVVCLHTWGGHGPSLHGGAAYTRLKKLKAQGVCVVSYLLPAAPHRASTAKATCTATPSLPLKVG